MNNSLLTKVTDYGLSILSSEIKDRATRYTLIGSTNVEDQNLITALDSNDLNNDLTYEILSNNNWIGHEGNILQKYFDRNNFLTFDFELPTDTTLNIYVYGFALLDVSGNKKELISITRSPSIFNKVKNTTALFSIKLTFGQEDISSQFRDNIHDSMFIDYNYLCKGTGNNGSDIIDCDIDVSSSSIGTKLKGTGIPTETVIIDNNGTDLSLQRNQIRINRTLTEDINNSSIFIVDTVYQQSDFITKAEFNKWQQEHNHNSSYYLKNETVVNSLKLDGKDPAYYCTSIDLNKLKDELKTKVNKNGDYIFGSLLSKLDKSTNFRENEFVPLFHIKNLIEELREYIETDYNDILLEKINKIIGAINLLSTNTKTSIVEAINELHSDIGDVELINHSDKKIVDILNFLLSVIGNKSMSNGLDIIQNIEGILVEKADKNSESIFTKRPKIEDNITDLNRLDSSSILTYSEVLKLLSSIRRVVNIDLTSYPKNKTYPLILNESGERKYTNSIIYNETNINLDRSVFRLEVNGTGALGEKYAAFLKVSHSCRGVEAFVKKIYVPSQSSAVIVFIRGGSNYYVEMNGTDDDPILVDNTYTLKGTATIVNVEEWRGTNKIQAGNWIFNRSSEINIDKDTNPHLGFDTII